MQSSNSRGYSEAHKSGKSAAASSCRSSVPPGALASYLQAQQAWRRLQASEKAIEQTCTRLRSSSHDQNDVFSGSCSSCNTSERKHGVNSLYSLPAHGCKAVARLFEQRHQLLNIHRHQRQVAKRCRVNTCHVEPAAGLLSLPEDVLVSPSSCVAVHILLSQLTT